jgi:hypothetical protein
MFVLDFGALKSNAGSYLLFNKTEVSVEDICLWSWQSVHGRVCGKWHSKWASKASSVIYQDLVVTSIIRLTTPGM